MKDERELLCRAVPLLVAWYEKDRKPLPWRAEPTPYHVWLSEIMLQQTRIEAVIPYYHRFLDALPDVGSLAAADPDRLMKLWQGLGYYSRARNLKKAAEIVVREYGGILPPEAAKLRALPGIGEYTAGAIASIAYGMPEPAVDGNVLRVIMRLCACEDDVAAQTTKRNVAGALRAVYPTGEAASLLTQGIMELGETICVPNGAPRCADCPLAALCRARAGGAPGQYPVKTPKKERRTEEKCVLLLSYEGRFAIKRRPERGLLAGLYEFPCFEKCRTASDVRDRLEADGFTVRSIKNIGKSKHLFTHIEWNMVGFAVECEKIPQDTDCVFKTKDEIFSAFAIPSAFRFYADALMRL